MGGDRRGGRRQGSIPPCCPQLENSNPSIMRIKLHVSLAAAPSPNLPQPLCNLLKETLSMALMQSRISKVLAWLSATKLHCDTGELQ